MAISSGSPRRIGVARSTADTKIAIFFAPLLLLLISSSGGAQSPMETDDSPRVFLSLSDARGSDEPSLLSQPSVLTTPNSAIPHSAEKADPLAVETLESDSSDHADGVRLFRPGLFARLLHHDKSEHNDVPRVARESWLRRPLSVTWFSGAVFGSQAIDNWVSEGNGMMGGLGLGWDFSNYWGTEFRFSIASPQLHDSDWALTARGAQSPSATNWHYAGSRQGSLVQFGINGLYYPWGDSPWRPYFLIGVGATSVSIDDCFNQRFNTTMFTMPLGVGMKYHWTDWMALRVECADNIALSNGGINTLHNLSVLGAVEVRFGGSRKTYWPWVPSR